MGVMTKYENTQGSSRAISVKQGSAPIDTINVIAFPGVDGNGVHYDKLFESLHRQYSEQTASTSNGELPLPILACYHLFDDRLVSPRSRRKLSNEHDFTPAALANGFVKNIEESLKGPCILVGYSSYSARLAFIATQVLQTKERQLSGAPGLGPFSFVSIDGASPKELERYSGQERAEMMLDLMAHFFTLKLELDFSKPTGDELTLLYRQDAKEQIKTLRNHISNQIEQARINFASRKDKFDKFETELKTFILPNMLACFEICDDTPVQNCIVLATQSALEKQKLNLDQSVRRIFRAQTPIARLDELFQQCFKHAFKLELPRMTNAEVNKWQMMPVEDQLYYFMDKIKSKLMVSNTTDSSFSEDSIEKFQEEVFEPIREAFLHDQIAIESDNWYKFLISLKTVIAILTEDALKLGWNAGEQCLISGDHNNLLMKSTSLDDIADKLLQVVWFHFDHIQHALAARYKAISDFREENLNGDRFRKKRSPPRLTSDALILAASMNKSVFTAGVVGGAASALTSSTGDSSDSVSSTPSTESDEFQFSTTPPKGISFQQSFQTTTTNKTLTV